MTLLCVSLTAATAEQMLQDARRARQAGADLVELRLDYLPAPHRTRLGELLAGSGPAIVTCRTTREGGHFDGPPAERWNLLVEACAHKPAYVDFEYSDWSGAPELRERVGHALQPPTRRILSFHDPQGRPTDLRRIVQAMEQAPGCEVVKVVWQARDICENFEALEILRSARRPAIVLCMGEAGAPSRVLARKFGALLTFCSLQAGAESAPGQISIERMKHLYRWDTIDAATAVYGVVACPVAHSMSPAMHNAAFAERAINAVYLPMRVEPGYEAFARFVGGCLERPWLDVRGLSVTIPHKLNALKFVGDNVEPLAAKIGAVNTLLFENGTVRGMNTDYAGALDALTEALGCERRDLRGARVAVLGAGGAGRAIVAGLRDCGCQVTIYNRTVRKAEALAAEFGCRALPLDDARRCDAEIVINTTSLGMVPHVDQTPLPAEALRASMTVFDTVYNPVETLLLRQAAQVGCKRIDGLAMLVNQAVKQFEAWTGQPAPRERMRQALLEWLGERDEQHPRDPTAPPRTRASGSNACGGTTK